MFLGVLEYRIFCINSTNPQNSLLRFILTPMIHVLNPHIYCRHRLHSKPDIIIDLITVYLNTSIINVINLFELLLTNLIVFTNYNITVTQLYLINIITIFIINIKSFIIYMLIPIFIRLVTSCHHHKSTLLLSKCITSIKSNIFFKVLNISIRMAPKLPTTLIFL